MLARNITIAVVFLVCVSMGAGQTTSTSALTLGDPRAEFRIEVFYDLECRSCVSFHQKLMKAIDRYPSKVFVVFRHFPLPMHDKAFMASSVVEAARKQGKGMEMIELLFEEQSKWSGSSEPYQLIFGYVKKLGLDRKRFTADVMSDEVARTVIRDMNRARRYGVQYTPATFLNGKLVDYVDSLELEKLISKGN